MLRTTFSPAFVQNLSLWLDAGDQSAIGPTSGGVGLVSNNGPVKFWKDKSSSGMNLTNSGADSVCPTFKLAAQNSRSILGFDGGDRISTTSASPLNSSTRTALVVCRRTGGSGEQCIFDRADNFAITVKSSGGWVLYFTNGTSGSRTLYANTFAATNSGSSYSVVTVRQDGTSGAAWLNGASQTLTTALSETGVTAGNFAVGSVGASAGLLFNGEVAEILIYTAALSDLERSYVERYLGAKWGVTVA